MRDALGAALTDTNPNSLVILQSDRIGKPWNVSQAGVQFTAQWEAFRSHLYDKDGGGGGGNSTIGYGHLVHIGPISGAPSEALYGNGITEPQALKLLHHDLREAERIVNSRIFVPLFQYEYDAVVDFIFNHRSGNNEFFALVNTGHYDQAPSKFLQYTAAHGKHGRINLQMHEAKAINPRLGGHTILKHVEKDEAWLRERLKREPQKRVVSSFYNLQVAELAISDVMNSNALKIQSWIQSPKNRIPLTLVKKVCGDIGYGVTRKTNELTKMNEVTVILKFQEYNNMPYYIFTAHVG
ncbi:RNase A-like domain-containing protein [Paraburkholderia sp. 32]|uniref:RNase A-like domain-containing protein n=1 Tax=Paraburkholderia sp. 32 TaxID=2991057 RepID=UPI003D1958EB